MIPDRVPQFTIPLFPYLKPGDEKLQVLKRIRPEDALNLQSMAKELKQHTITTLGVDEKLWSVVSAYSPYSPDIHVMVIETSTDRYLPGPERIPDKEGDDLMELWAVILDFIGKRTQNASVHVGYNWSPRAWGEEEEKNGFQSIPTKWHAMLWGWPQFPRPKKTTEIAKWVDSQSLSPEVRRILGENNYAEPFGSLIKNRLEKAFPEGTLFIELFPHWDWKIDGRGIYAPFNNAIPEILRIHGFFSQVLRPMSLVLEEIMRELSETMTTLDCSLIDKILTKTEDDLLTQEDIETLRAVPTLRPIEEISSAFREREYPETLLEAILDPILNRCSQKGNHLNWWRKGFGYALVLSGPSNGNSGEIRIMPGVFVGPGGVVEAQGIVLQRPEDKQVPESEIKERSSILWQLAETLKTHFRE